LSQKRCGQNLLKRPRSDFHADSRAGTQSRSIQSIPDCGESYCIGDVVVGCHLQQLSRHPVGGFLEALSGLGFDGWALPPWCVQTRPPTIAARLHLSPFLRCAGNDAPGPRVWRWPAILRST
jgi:hypothetical protein